MIAALPMYDRAETAAAHDALWADVRERLGFGPPTLSRDISYDQSWERDDLLLGQICNLPYRAAFKNRLIRIGNADYGLPDTPAGYYHSVFVVRTEDAARGLAPALLGRFAYNNALSESGWGAAQAYVAERGLQFHTTLCTGSHVQSACAVADGAADLACIDAVTWRDLQSYEPFTKTLTAIARTRLSPGMTFVTANTNTPAPIRAALSGAIASLSSPHAQTLGLRGLRQLPDAAFNMPLAPEPA